MALHETCLLYCRFAVTNLFAQIELLFAFIRVYEKNEMIYNSTKNLLAFHYSNAVWLRFFFANNHHSIMHAHAHSLSHLAIGIRLNRKLSCLISIVFLASILAAIDFHRACIFDATTQHNSTKCVIEAIVIHPRTNFQIDIVQIVKWEQHQKLNCPLRI